jgi:hypothetical protein
MAGQSQVGRANCCSEPLEYGWEGLDQQIRLRGPHVHLHLSPPLLQATHESIRYGSRLPVSEEEGLPALLVDPVGF